jgi:hypothetical protein
MAGAVMEAIGPAELMAESWAKTDATLRMEARAYFILTRWKSRKEWERVAKRRKSATR